LTERGREETPGGQEGIRGEDHVGVFANRKTFWDSYWVKKKGFSRVREERENRR